MTDGSRSWEQAWQQALYAPDGFYRRDAPAQHFATSAQGIPGAGELLADALALTAREHGCSALVDIGAGRGELLAALARRAPELRLIGVDVVDRPPGLAIDSWLVSPGGATLPASLRDLQNCLVVAHEWLDVVPCPVVQRDRHGVWREVRVTRALGGPGVQPQVPDSVTESLGAALQGSDLAWAERWLEPESRRAEIGLPRERALAELVSRVRSGLVLVVDYGHRRQDRPRGGTLTGFRSGRQVDPVPDGSTDITAHVAVDALLEAVGPRADAVRQGPELRRLLGDPSVPVPHALARSEPAAYLARVARRSALTALSTGPLADFWWLRVPVPADVPGTGPRHGDGRPVGT